MLDKLAEHFQKNFYPDMDVSEVRAHLDNPEVLDNGMAHLKDVGHPDSGIMDKVKSFFQAKEGSKRWYKKQFQDVRKEQLDIVQHPDYKKKIATEYNLNLGTPEGRQKADEIIAIQIKSLKTVKPTTEGVPNIAEAAFTPMDMSLAYRERNPEGFKNNIRHEFQHVKDKTVGTYQNQFDSSLYDMYKNKGFIKPDINAVDFNPNDEKARDKRVDKLQDDFYKEMELKAAQYRKMLPNFSKYYQGGNNSIEGEYYIDPKTNKRVTPEYIQQNYKDFFVDPNNWKEELQLMKYHLKPSTGMRPTASEQPLEDKLNGHWEGTYPNNVWVGGYAQKNPFLNKIDKEFYGGREQMSDKQTDILNRKGEENAVSKSEIVHNASDETFNPDAVEKTDFPEIDGGEYYYYRPTEVRARLKVLRSAAQDKGYIDEKKSGHINKWIPKIQGNEEVDKAYDDLKTKVKMSDDDINSLINKFSYKQNDQPQLNNIV